MPLRQDMHADTPYPLDLSRDLQRIHKLPRQPVLTGNPRRTRLHLSANIQRQIRKSAREDRKSAKHGCGDVTSANVDQLIE